MLFLPIMFGDFYCEDWRKMSHFIAFWDVLENTPKTCLLISLFQQKNIWARRFPQNTTIKDFLCNLPVLSKLQKQTVIFNFLYTIKASIVQQLASGTINAKLLHVASITFVSI